MIVILVVSNEPRIGRHVRSVLGSQGWWVTAAADREEALRASADQQPGLVVVDCEIEGAAELVRTCGAKYGGPGVLLLEPPGDGDGAFHAFEAGADQILSKPPQAKALLEAAERVMSMPHQSAGTSTTGVGEKFSAAEIFGDVLDELESTKSGTDPGEEAPLDALERPDGSPEAETAPEVAPEAQEAASGVEIQAGEETWQPDRTAASEEPSIPADKEEAVEPVESAEPAEPADGLEDAATPFGAGAAEPAESEEESSFRFDPKDLGAEVEELAAGSAASGPSTAEPEPAVDAVVEPTTESDETDPEAELPSPAVASGDPAHTVSVPAPVSSGDKGRFGQYRLDDRIAVGGMAEVWRASMLGMEGFRKTVAIKKILPHLAENSEFVAMFIEEAKLAAQLSHENLVEIYDLGKIDESFFIAMEYVDGKDLRALLNRLRQASEQMPIGLALLIGAEVARGLEYAHTREDSDGRALDLVHRDVSPRNVLIANDGRVRLCDFGVAKAVSSVIQTQIGALKGKLQYMSPEQASGRPVDNRSDIYSLGSVMYEMISGRRLYEADNEISLLDAARAGNFDDPRTHCPGLPQEVRRILIKALAKKPAARYQAAGELEADLRALLQTLEPTPAAYMLGTFVSDLFSDRAPAEVQSLSEDNVAASAVTTTMDGVNAATRSWPADKSSGRRKIARFWWGVVAGLLAAGLGAVLLRLLLR